MKHILLIFFPLTFFNGTIFSQSESDYFHPENIHRFALYLEQQHEYIAASTEYARLLQNFSGSRDSITIKIGLCYLKAKEYKLAAHYFGSIPPDPDSRLMKEVPLWKSCSYFFMKEYDSCLQTLSTLPQQRALDDNRAHVQLLSASTKIITNPGGHVDFSTVDTNSQSMKRLKEIYDQENNSSRKKSPATAAILSAIVPGLGKVYGGKTIDGVISFVSVSLIGWQAYEGFSREGKTSVQGWLLGALGLSFYLGNIYGSALDIEIQNHTIDTAFENEIHTLVKISYGL